jgi:2-keto-3-deoxy-L-rhamnonate aldolase RhmA
MKLLLFCCAQRYTFIMIFGNVAAAQPCYKAACEQYSRGENRMAIVKNTVKQRLRDGKIAASFNVSRLRTVEIPQIAKACGFHWVFIDLEHSTMDLDTAGQIAGAALPVGIAPIVRDVNRAARILDAGAQGAIFPHVQNADEARAFTKACKFRPIGSRSLSYGGPRLEYDAVPAVEAMRGGNEETLVVMMIETPEAVKNATEIAAVEGVDVLLVGGSDLSTTMGISGQFTNPDFLKAIDTVIAAAQGAGKWPGLGGIYDEAILPDFVKHGMRFFLGGVDMSFILAGGRARAKFFNELTV